MEVIVIKLPYLDFLTISALDTIDHQVISRYHQSQEIIDAEIELKLKRQELKDLEKQLYNLKYPKK